MNEVFEELRAALYQVWNRRWVALGVAWGVCVLGWLVVALIPNSYESRARIYVQVDDVLSQQLEISGDGKKELVRVRQTLASAVNLEKVVRATKLGEDITTDSEIQGAVTSLTENVIVKGEQDNLFEVSATIGKSDLSDAENAKLSQDVVAKLLDIFRGQAGGFGIDVDLHRRDVRKGVDGDVVNRAHSEVADDQKRDYHQEFIMQGGFDQFVQHEMTLFVLVAVADLRFQRQ